MARKYVVREPKGQRPMINNEQTAAIKQKMMLGAIPFVIGAIGLVGSMGDAIPDKQMRLVVLIVALVMFLFGILVIVNNAKALKDYSDAYWEKYDQKKYGSTAKEDYEKREKITWAQAKAEYKQEAKTARKEASRMAAEKFAEANAPVQEEE